MDKCKRRQQQQYESDFRPRTPADEGRRTKMRMEKERTDRNNNDSCGKNSNSTSSFLHKQPQPNGEGGRESRGRSAHPGFDPQTNGNLYKTSARGLNLPTRPSARIGDSGWVMHIHSLLAGSAWIAAQIALQAAYVLVHRNDGRDRTTQLVSLAGLLLDPYYRTFEGFQALVEKDWLAFGHPFANRLGTRTFNMNALSPESPAANATAISNPIFL